MARLRTPIHEDLGEFVKFAPFFDQGGISLAAIAAKLGTTVPSLKECMKRIERYYGIILTTSRTRTASGNHLTQEGQLLYHKIREVVQPEFVKQLMGQSAAVDLIRMVASHSLVTSHLISQVFADFLREHGSEADVRLDLRTAVDFEEVRNEIREGSLDAALLWAVPQRLIGRHGFAWELIGPAFDVVIISADEDKIESLRVGQPGAAPDLARLAEARVITLNARNQAAESAIPNPIPKLGQRIEVGSIDAVIALVRSRVGDFGVIPAIPRVLDPLRANQLLFLSNPIEKIRIGLFTQGKGRGSLSRLARDLVCRIEKHLTETVPRTDVTAGPVRHEIPQTADFFSGLRFGYFVETVRRENKKMPAHWAWETVRVKELQTLPDGNWRIIYNVTNHFGREFKAVGHLVNNKTFVLEAIRTDENASKSHDETVKSFVAVFEWGWLERGVMYGHWLGQDEEGNSMIYPELWSGRKLERRELIEIARCAKTFTAEGADSYDPLDTPEYKSLSD